ncbi:MAG: prepilin-type N-terminal cleavage/methylation domain-containing protein [Desulfobacterales bacterium]|nr:prepilin-type N-terminal cleavage/methylation domain-containing protein [Desulfobacterales bacterium]
MYYSLKNRERGFTLIELLIAMAISGIVLSAIVSTFIIQRKSYDVQEQITEMVQSARAAMDMMTREIRMAGYDPTGAGFDGIPYNDSQLQIFTDLNDDGTPDDSNENITYTYDGTNLQIDRNTGGGGQPFAENIQSFIFAYLDSAGSATTTTADIRQIQITIIARTAKRDPDYSPNGGYRTYTLTSLITPPNLAF